MAYLKKKEELKERKELKDKKLDLLAEKNFENINKLIVGFLNKIIFYKIKYEYIN